MREEPFKFELTLILSDSAKIKLSDNLRMTTGMAVTGRRVTQRLRGAAESSGSDELDDAHNGGGDMHAGAESMDFVEPEPDLEGDALLMGDDDDLGASSRMIYSFYPSSSLCVFNCLELSRPFLLLFL